MKSLLHPGAATLAALLALTIAGCAVAPPERFYRLVVPRAEAPAAATPGGPVIAVGAVVLPEWVDRPQIATVGPGSRVQVAEGHRWAEPLRPAVGRVVAEQLARQLGSSLVYAYPQVAVAEPAFRVTLNVQRFDAELGGAVDDEVLWTVRRVADGQLRSGRSVGRVATTEASHDALAAAHVAALAVVSREIAQAIVELGPR